MKKIFLFALLFLIQSIDLYANDVHMACKILSSMAQKTMEARQSGMPVGIYVDKLSRNGKVDVSDISYLLISEAYKEPIHSTKEKQLQSIIEFGNKYYLLCIDSVKNKK